MKTKHIFLVILSLSICHTAEAQFFKKLKNKAKQAAERTVLKKPMKQFPKKPKKPLTVLQMETKIKQKPKIIK